MWLLRVAEQTQHVELSEAVDGLGSKVDTTKEVLHRGESQITQRNGKSELIHRVWVWFRLHHRHSAAGLSRHNNKGLHLLFCVYSFHIHFP
jgi:hypothetical protein